MLTLRPVVRLAGCTPEQPSGPAEIVNRAQLDREERTRPEAKLADYMRQHALT